MEASNMLDIKWDEVDPKFNFAAMDSNGWVCLFTEFPLVNPYFGSWHGSSALDRGVTYNRDGHSILKKQVNWKETLTERPVK